MVLNLQEQAAKLKDPQIQPEDIPKPRDIQITTHKHKKRERSRQYDSKDHSSPTTEFKDTEIGKIPDKDSKRLL